jgi:hypothetical protein
MKAKGKKRSAYPDCPAPAGPAQSFRLTEVRVQDRSG